MFALARTEARLDEAYGFTSLPFREACDGTQWSAALSGEVARIRASNGFAAGAPLAWKVELVEPTDDVGIALVSLQTTGRHIEFQTWSWRRTDGQWWFDDPPSEVC